MGSVYRERFDAMVEEATVDCDNEAEQGTPIFEAPLPAPPQGSERVEVYRFWLAGARGR